jgi:hypothetical protein
VRSQSRLRGGGIGQIFTSTTPTCPAGQHWVADAPVAIRGLARELAISACVPNIVVHLQLKPPPAPAPAPVVVKLAPAVYQPPPPAVVSTPAPSVTVFPAPPQVVDAAPPPVRAAAPGLICPAPWPLWWLVVAGAAGAFAGHLMKKDRTLKKNLGRVVNAVGGRMVDRASRPVVARLLG